MSNKGKYNWSDIWMWKVTSTKAKNFLMGILPYLRIKKEQARIAIEFQGLRGDDRSYRGHKLTPDQLNQREEYRIILSQMKGIGAWHRGRIGGTTHPMEVLS